MPPTNVKITPNDAAAVIRRNRERATAFAHKAGSTPVRLLLERTHRDLLGRLVKAEGLGGAGKDSFTAAQLRVTLEQVRDVLTPLKQGLSNTIVQSGVTAAVDETQQLVGYMRDADRAYRGIGQGLQINEAAIMTAAVSGTERSILTRIESNPADPRRPGVLARYGASVIGSFEEELQQRFIAKTPWEDVKAALTTKSSWLQGKPAFWAERIVRTEVMNANNRAGLETIKAADEQLGDMCKILCATFDQRTGADSFAVHGQIRRPNEAFVSWFGSYMHPPNRPNDREIVVPHRVCWPIPPELRPKSFGEIAARWALEGRKGSPPGQPQITTIDLARFGKEQPPPPKPEPIKPPEPEPNPKPELEPEQPQPVPLDVGDQAPEPAPPKPRRKRAPPKPKGIPAGDDIELPLPSGLIKQSGFAPDRSAVGGQVPVFPGTRAGWQAVGVADVYRLPLVHGEEVAFKWGAAAPLIPPPKSGPAKPYADVLRALGKIEKTLEEHGEDFELNDDRLGDVHATKATVDRRVIAAMIAKPLLAPDVVPTYIKHEGTYYLHAGHEELMSAAIGGTPKTNRQSKLIDLDKLKKPPAPKPREVAQKISYNIGGQSVACQTAVRHALRDQLSTLGVVTRDDRRGYSLWDFPKPGTGLNEVEVANNLPGADATHSWNGKVHISKHTLNSAQDAMQIVADGNEKVREWQKSGRDPDSISNEMDGMRVLLHEEAHGASPARPSSCQGVGLGVEEAVTEIIARKASREMIGVEDAWALPKKNRSTGKYEGGFWCYQDFICGLFNAVAEHTGDAMIGHRIEQAAVETRKWHNGEMYKTSEDQITDFAKRLVGPDGKPIPTAARDALIRTLSDPDGGMMKKR